MKAAATVVFLKTEGDGDSPKETRAAPPPDVSAEIRRSARRPKGENNFTAVKKLAKEKEVSERISQLVLARIVQVASFGRRVTNVSCMDKHNFEPGIESVLSRSLQAFELRLPASPEAPGRARRSLEAVDHGAPPETLQAIALLVSELVTNSVRHAKLSPRDTIGLSFRAGEGFIRIEVSDAGDGFERPSHPAPCPDGSGGWGLCFVDEVADAWGAGRVGGRFRVWAEARW